MKERLKQLRLTLGLNQQDFANKLEIGRSSIANYEAGTREPTSSVISLICQTWHVNREWLVSGTGDMFIGVHQDSEIQELINEMLFDESADLKRRLVAAVLRLSPDQISRAVDWIKDTFGLVDAADICNTFSEAEQAEIDAAGEAAMAAKRAEILDKTKVRDA